VSEARNLKSRIRLGRVLSEDPRGEFFLALLAADGCQHSLAFLGLEQHLTRLCLLLHMVPSLCGGLSVSSHGVLLSVSLFSLLVRSPAILDWAPSLF